MSLSFHINFNGQCLEAFEFYAQLLGGTIGVVLAVKDSPLASQFPQAWQDKIVHANIVIQGVELAGADLSPPQYQKPQGFFILLGFDSASQVEFIFNQLAQGGEVILPPQATFFSRSFAMVTDRFGVPWKLSCTV